MKILTYICGLTVAFAAVCAGPAMAASTPKYLMPEAAKAAEPARAGQILVGQAEIKSNINQSYVAVAAGGGLLAAMIDAKIEADRAKRAEVAIVPVRDALTGFDIDSLAVAATKKILADSPWLAAGEPAFGRDISVLGRSAMLDASTTDQMVFFEYTYDLSPDFSTVRVSLAVTIAPKAVAEGKKPETRLSGKSVIYSQTLVSAVSLAAPSKEMNENAAQWAVDGGKPARVALTQAFDQLGVLAPKAFAMTAADVKTMNGKDKKFVAMGGYTGKLQETTADGSLLFFGGGLIHIRTLAQ